MTKRLFIVFLLISGWAFGQGTETKVDASKRVFNLPRAFASQSATDPRAGTFSTLLSQQYCFGTDCLTSWNIPLAKVSGLGIASTSSVGLVKAPNCTVQGSDYYPQSLNTDGTWNCVRIQAGATTIAATAITGITGTPDGTKYLRGDWSWATLPASAPATADNSKFTILVEPDNQYYVNAAHGGTFAMLTALNNYATTIKADAILAVGDNFEWVNYAGNVTNVDTLVSQWNATNIPWITAIGNHDYDTASANGYLSGRASTAWETHIGSAMRGKSYVKGTYEAGNAQSVWADLGSKGGKHWGIITLEFCPRSSVLTWANSVLDAHPDMNFLLVTHNYLSNTGRYDGAGFEDANTCVNMGMTGTKNVDYNEAQGIWDNVIKNHDRQIRAVFSGHWSDNTPPGYYSYNQRHTGLHGYLVDELFADYQFFPEGGSGLGRIYTIYGDGAMTTQTYSPYYGDNRNLTTSKDQMSLSPPIIGGGTAYQVNGTALSSQTTVNITSGSNTTVTDGGNGTIRIDATMPSATTGVPAGTLLYPYQIVSAASADWKNYSMIQKISGPALLATPTSWKFYLNVVATIYINKCRILRTNKSSLSVIDSTPVTWGGQASPTLSPGNNATDAISLALDHDHDYYVVLYYSDVAGNTSASLGTFPCQSGVTGTNTLGPITCNYGFAAIPWSNPVGDNTGITTIPSRNSTANGYIYRIEAN